ncbi:LIC12162 family protein [Verrucomicrobia bacterium]|nr:LIC12162 family protein [Verrucomicrobiota bacterium]
MPSTKQLLVTTALEETWGDGRSIHFLGNWCLSYKRKHLLDELTFKVQAFHWKDRNKFHSDHEYLKELYERVLGSLCSTLNKLHNVKRTKEYWRIILGPWLLTWIAILWDRWESIRIALLQRDYIGTICLTTKDHDMIPNDYIESHEWSNSDSWNHWIYTEIFKYISYDKIINDEKNFAKPPSISDKKDYKYYIKNCVDRILMMAPGKEKVLFTASYFDLHSLILLSLKLRQIPRLNYFFQKNSRFNNPILVERNLNLEMDSNTDFEHFLKSIILKNIPKAHFEGYKDLLKKAQKITSKASVILTANTYFYGELFKVWAAERITKGTRLIVSKHGGSILSKYSRFDHDESIADITTVWHKSIDKNHVRLTPTKLIRAKKYKPKNQRIITIVGLELPRYSYRWQSGPNSSLLLEDYEQKLVFIRSLNSSSYSALQVRPYPDRGWQTRDRYIDDIGSNKISRGKTIYEDIHKSKIVICTYPVTTFSEAMWSGVPTILLFTEQYWETLSIFNSLIKHLKKAKIIFSDPKQAANHINDIEKDPMTFWNKTETIVAREAFIDMCCKVESSWLHDWSQFLSKQTNAKK